jgi:hypothetical protein
VAAVSASRTCVIAHAGNLRLGAPFCSPALRNWRYPTDLAGSNREQSNEDPSHTLCSLTITREEARQQLRAQRQRHIAASLTAMP